MPGADYIEDDRLRFALIKGCLVVPRKRNSPAANKHSGIKPLAYVIIAFVLSRIICFGLGIRFDLSPLGNYWQFIDPELLRTGIYRYLRHPIYAAGLYDAWGVFFKQPSLIGAGLAFLTCVMFTLTAKIEEVENTKYFGAAYQDYIRRTRMFIPFLF